MSSPIPVPGTRRAALDGSGRRRSCPVHHSNCRHAWATSISRPPIVCAPGLARPAQQRGFERVVDQVVDDAARPRDSRRDRRRLGVRPGADRRRVDEQVPARDRRPARRSTRSSPASASAASRRRALIATRAPCARRPHDGAARRAARAENHRAASGQPNPADARAARGTRRRRSCAPPSRPPPRRSVFTAPMRALNSSAAIPCAEQRRP